MLSSLRLFPSTPAHWSLAGLFVLLMVLPGLTQAQCPSGDVDLTNQAQVDAFPPGCTNFPGNLDVSGENITNLNGLRNLTSVGNDLRFNNNPQLTSLMGLNNLRTVGNDLQLNNNPVLSSIAALTALISVTNSLQISNNPQLTSITGLSKLQTVGNSVGGDFQLNNNSALTSIAALTALTSVGGDLQIISNPVLTSIAALTALTNVGNSLQLVNNTQLTSLTGLNNLQQVGGDLRLNNDPALTNIAALTALTSVGNSLLIGDNNQLTSLTGLNNLQRVGGDLQINNNPALTSIAALTGLTSVGSSLQINNDTQLTGLMGLNNLKQIGNTFQLNNNPALTSIAALTALTSVGSDLQIGSNPVLTSIAALTALTSVGNSLQLVNNTQLTSLTGLNNLQQVGNDLQIRNNNALSVCSLPAICQLIATKSPNRLNISDNAPGCSSVQDVQENCISITAQPASASAVCSGTTVTITVSTSGNVRAYQWYREGTPITGQTSATLTLTNVQPSQSGAYRVVVSNSASSLTSTAFSLTVNALPTVSISPSATAVCAGQSATFSATPGLTAYRWTTPNGGPVLTTASISGSVAGTYSLTVTNASGCTATASASLTVNPLPTVSISPSATAVCAGQSATFAATPGLATYRWTTPNGGPTLTTASISVSVAGTYTLTVTNASGCTATTQASLTVNPMPTPTIVGLPASICQEAAPVTLTGNPAGGVFTIDGLPATTFNPAKLTVGQHTVVYSYTNNNGCSATSSQTVTIKPTPQTPTIATQSGHAYPAGQSNLTISQNTGNVVLMVSGCPGGTITWAGGSNNTLAVATMNTGVQTFSATCQTNGCTSPIATATVTVVGTTLSVLHRDGNGQTNTNTLAPYLQLNNQGTTTIPYSEITVRYWLTVENYAPLLFSINYAQLGSDKVHLKYVPATTGNPKATGYIEFSFDASAGSLGAGQNSGPIQDLINKQDYSYFDQSNDYSYANPGNFTPNERITAYRNGVLFYGMEPGPVTPMQSVKAQSQNNSGADANTIEAVLAVTNDGNQPISYGDLKVRYYFTQDNTQPLVLSQAGYTALGAGNVTAQLVTISPALAGADRYLELSFSSSLGQLAPGSGTGGVTYQLRHADYSGFNQTNDYSYQGTGGTMLNPHVVVFVAGQRVYGTEPGTNARQGAETAEVPLSVRVLGNPLTGSVLELEVTGAEGQPLRLELSDSNGRVVGERSLERAGAVEHQTLPVGAQPAGLLLLRVSTPTQSQTVKVLKIH